MASLGHNGLSEPSVEACYLIMVIYTNIMLAEYLQTDVNTRLSKPWHENHMFEQKHVCFHQDECQNMIYYT